VTAVFPVPFRFILFPEVSQRAVIPKNIIVLRFGTNAVKVFQRGVSIAAWFDSGTVCVLVCTSLFK
jgi:hypothetical protein